MENKYNKLTLNTIIFAIGSFGSKVVSFFLVPLYTNVLKRYEYGTADLIISITNLLLPIISMSIGEAILFFGLKERENKEKVLKNGLLVWMVGAVAMLALTPMLNFYSGLRGYALYTSVYTVFLSLRLSLQLYTKANEKNMIFSIDSIIHVLLVCVFNILFLVVFRWGIKGYLLAFLIAEILSAVFLFVYNRGLKIVVRVKFDKEYLLKMLKYSAPLILNSISWALAHSTDKIMIESMISMDAVGVYSVASRIPTMINTITNFFCQAWTMSAILEYETKDKRFYKKTFSVFSMLLCFAVSAILLILKPFMSVYVGSDFFQAWKFVPFLLMAAIFQNFSSFFGSIIQSAKQNGKLLITSLASCFCNIGLNFLLIPVLGVQGAVVGTLGSYVVVGVLRMLFGLRVIRFDIGYLRLAGVITILLVQSVMVVNDCFAIVASVLSLVVVSILFFNEIKELSGFFLRKILRKKV